NRSAVKKRGFCHIKAVAKYISKRTGHKTADAVKKIKETQPQNKLVRKKRLTNLKDAFKAEENARGIKAALLDDVFTTGSTINEAAKALKKAGAESVIGVVAARSI
ncbi:MAG: ComF family protein, partial [bacterium]